MKKIYLDYAGTTPIDSRVLRIVLEHFKNSWGNVSSVHEVGRQAKMVLEGARKDVARVLGCRFGEVVFTGSGTESANLAILGFARANRKYGRHIITSKIEHHAVLRACQYLEKHEGFRVTYLGVNKGGLADPEELSRVLKADTVLVSIMYANNEIGIIQPIAEMAKIISDFRHNKTLNFKRCAPDAMPIFHTDACQAAGALSLNVNQLGVDLMTLNGSKIYGPKGTGCLYVRRGVDILPVIIGGSQERGLRAGTENPALIAGFVKALELANGDKQKESRRLSGLRDYTIGRVLKTIPGSRLNGDAIKRLPNNINISFEKVDGEMLMLMLDQNGIQVSTGSACTSTSNEPSHVIRALRLPASLVGGNLRVSLGRYTTKKDLDVFLKTLATTVNRLRK